MICTCRFEIRKHLYCCIAVAYYFRSRSPTLKVLIVNCFVTEGCYLTDFVFNARDISGSLLSYMGFLQKRHDFSMLSQSLFSDICSIL